jgi:hypothetical protein
MATTCPIDLSGTKAAMAVQTRLQAQPLVLVLPLVPALVVQPLVPALV